MLYESLYRFIEHGEDESGSTWSVIVGQIEKNKRHYRIFFSNILDIDVELDINRNIYNELNKLLYDVQAKLSNIKNETFLKHIVEIFTYDPWLQKTSHPFI